MKRKIEILVLSNIYLGTKNCKAAELHNYLKHIKPNIIILNGNILATKNLKNLSGDHLRVFGRLVKLLTQGTRIYYLAGNIDASLRRFADFSNGQLFVRDQLVLKLAGKKYWFIHGSLFNKTNSQQIAPANRVEAFFRRIFSKKKATEAHFEHKITHYALHEGYDVVVSGHTHTPKMSQVNGIEYFNAGDWTENMTALEFNGYEWTLHRYDKYAYRAKEAELTPSAADDDDTFLNLSKQLLKPKEYVVVQNRENHDWAQNDSYSWTD